MFESQWNFPNSIGALDGKQGTFSIVLMALVDADYKFIYVDIGCNSRISDRRVFCNYSLLKATEHKDRNIPPSRIIYEEIRPLPYVIVSDYAFPLKENMKPYPLGNLPHEKKKNSTII